MTQPPISEKPLTLSIIIPALNEEDSICKIIDRVLAVKEPLRDTGISHLELIVVDDGSTDGTAEMVRANKEVQLVQHPVNLGYGAALKTGFRVASGQYLGFLDADGTYPPEYLPELCQAIQEGADVVVGSRRSGASSEMPLVRQVGNYFWSNLLTGIAGRKVIDPASGMRVFRREALEYIYPLPDGLNFTPVMSTRSAHEELRVVELPIPYKERLGRSKLNVVRDGVRFLHTILWTALNYNPVRIFGGIGVMFSALAILIGIMLVSMRIMGVTTLGPWGVGFTFLAVVLIVAGINIFTLGVTFNYLVSLFHKRPVRQGLFGRPIFKTPLDRQFGWLGGLALAIGCVFGIMSFFLALNSWPIDRLWLYLLAGTMLVLIGIQLITFWLIVRVLDDLSQREIIIQGEINKSDNPASL